VAGNFKEQVGIENSVSGYFEVGESMEVVIVPRHAGGEGLFHGLMSEHVKNGRLLPESAIHMQDSDSGGAVTKNVGERFLDVGQHRPVFCGMRVRPSA
jgi:hypothetical protein